MTPVAAEPQLAAAYLAYHQLPVPTAANTGRGAPDLRAMERVPSLAPQARSTIANPNDIGMSAMDRKGRSCLAACVGWAP